MKDITKEQKETIVESYKKLTRNRYSLFVDLIEPTDIDYGIKPLIIKLEKLLKIKIEYHSFRAWVYKVYRKKTQNHSLKSQQQEKTKADNEDAWNILDPKKEKKRGTIIFEQIKPNK